MCDWGGGMWRSGEIYITLAGGREAVVGWS